MGSIAVGSYLETLRRYRRIRLPELLAEAGMSEANWYRLRKGQVRPSGERLSRLLAAVAGGAADVADLLQADDDRSGIEARQLGRERAHHWLDEEQRERVAALRLAAGPEALHEALERVRLHYQREPAFVDRLLEFLDTLERPRS